MAPKASKGKSTAAAEKEQALAVARLARARFRCAFVNEEAVGKLRLLVAGPRNEHGATMLKPESIATPPLDGDVPTFTCFLKMGLVPPLSEFFVATMETYGLHLTQLHPNALLTLSIFAHLCEGFVGVMPSVALFRHFFIPRIETKKPPISGGVTFRLRNGLSGEFIPTTFKSKWEEWRHDWCYVHFDPFYACLADPDAAATHDDSFKELSPRDEDLRAAVERIKVLRQRGLTGNMVAADFLGRRLAPLQRRSHPAWAYAGPADKTRLWPGLDHNLRPEVLAYLLREIFIPSVEGVLPATVYPLCNDNQRTAILAAMPRCNALGIVGADEAAAPRRRLETLAQKAARIEGGSSREGGSPRGSGGAGEDDDDEEDSEPLVRRRARVRSEVGATSAEAEAGAASVQPEVEDVPAEPETEAASAEPEAEAASAEPEAEAVPAETEQEQPPPQTPASPVRTAPASSTRGLALKRKTWVSVSDDEE